MWKYKLHPLLNVPKIAAITYTIPMATPKYKKIYQELVENNQELLNQLKDAYYDYKEDKSKAEVFKDLQLKALRVIRRAEDRLCSKTESTQFSSFSTTLADKFWEEVRANYPEIDYSAE